MRDAVRYDKNTTDPIGRRLAQRRMQGSEDFGAAVLWIVARGFDDMRLDIVEFAQTLAQVF